jgi:hypothetical protein
MFRANKTAVAAAFAALLVLGGPDVAAAADADVIQQTRDREEISALMWAYVRALDTLNEEAYVKVFTPDGAFGQTKGAEALRKMIVDLKKSRAEREAKGDKPTAMYHIDTNEHVEFITPDHARVHYYWMTVFAGAERGQPARTAAVGHGVDDVVRVNGKWLIKSRNVAAPD